MRETLKVSALGYLNNLSASLTDDTSAIESLHDDLHHGNLGSFTNVTNVFDPSFPGPICPERLTNMGVGGLVPVDTNPMSLDPTLFLCKIF
jgi:hypothetical protein